MAIVVASMIGTGVFTTSGFLLTDLHAPRRVIAAWVVGGILAGLGALSYGALARHLPESGGEYTFLSRTFHPSAGFLAGWVSLFAGFAAPLAAAAMGFGEYARPWLGAVPVKVTASVLVLAFAALHGADVRMGAAAQDGFVLLKVLLILVFVFRAGTQMPPVPIPPTTPFDPGAFAVSLVWISYSFSGWNAAVYIAGEVREPERNLPSALLMGTGIVLVLYVCLNLVFVHSAPVGELAGKLDVGRIAAEAVCGARWGGLMTALVALALLTSISSLTMAGPRVTARMAEDGELPRILAPGGGPPRAAMALQAVIALLLVWTTAYDQLLTFIGFTLGLSAAATVLGLIRLRYRLGSQVRVPGWPFVPVFFVLATLCISAFSIHRRPQASLAGIGFLTAGWFAWWLRFRRSAPERNL